MEAVTELGYAGYSGALARQASETTETRPVEATLETQAKPEQQQQRPSVFVQTAAVAELVQTSAAALAENSPPPEPTDAEARGGLDVYG